ncbi:hypothetical protein HDV63DRAFT_414445 [Trichoderma sp. SZMC 28014]
MCCQIFCAAFHRLHPHLASQISLRVSGETLTDSRSIVDYIYDHWKRWLEEAQAVADHDALLAAANDPSPPDYPAYNHNLHTMPIEKYQKHVQEGFRKLHKHQNFASKAQKAGPSGDGILLKTLITYTVKHTAKWIKSSEIKAATNDGDSDDVYGPDLGHTQAPAAQYPVANDGTRCGRGLQEARPFHPVLTALTLCLGGKASDTNRGGSLKSFVKEGANMEAWLSRSRTLDPMLTSPIHTASTWILRNLRLNIQLPTMARGAAGVYKRPSIPQLPRQIPSTALTLCLGGKASDTTRGGSLKSFVKEGREHGSLVVRIKNAGSDASGSTRGPACKASDTNRGGSLKSFVKEGREHGSLVVRIKNAGSDASGSTRGPAGKASDTNRGGSLKSFVKEGREHGSLVVKVKDAGSRSRTLGQDQERWIRCLPARYIRLAHGFTGTSD